jgi:hypothetical protein
MKVLNEKASCPTNRACMSSMSRNRVHNSETTVPPRRQDLPDAMHRMPWQGKNC